MMPSADPALSSNSTSEMRTRPDPGAATVIFSTFSEPCGLGIAIGSTALPSAITVSLSRRQALRADDNVLPVADGEIDRGQRPCRRDRAGDDGAR